MTYFIVLIIILLIIILIVFPKWQVKIAKKELSQFSHSLDPKDKLSLAKDLMALENTYRLTLSQILGGAVVVLSIYFSLQNLNNAQKSLELSQDGQITDRFTNAINQLGDDNTDINIGGIYALQRIADESEKDYWPIIEILTAYVRRKAPLDMPDSTKGSITFVNADLNYRRPNFDIQAVMTVLAKRNVKIEDQADQVVHLEKTFLQGIVLDYAHLKGASFINTDLANSSFRSVALDSSSFRWALLAGVNFENASMRYVDLSNADLSFANLNNAHLEHADLTKADLRASTFRTVYVTGANFTETKLGGLDLSKAIGLTKKQISVAKIDEYTKLPKDLR